MVAAFVLGPTRFLRLLGPQAMSGVVADFASVRLYIGAGSEGGTTWRNSRTSRTESAGSDDD